MPLVKLTNVGEAPYRATFDGKNYIIDPDGGFVIVDANVAKHWLGDWEIQNDDNVPTEEKMLEQRRVSKYNTSPNPGYKVVIEEVVQEKKTEKDYSVLDKKTIVINKDIVAPGVNEEEFADLKKLKKKSTKKTEE